MAAKTEHPLRPEGNPHGAPPRRRVAGHAVFFPLATVHAIFALPATVLSMLGVAGIFPGLSSPAFHAHEMLFGFALAVVAGNQLGPISAWRLGLLAVLWTVARAAMLLAPEGAAAAMANVLFALLLAAQIAPRLLGAAKKWRNQALPWVLIGICASSVGFQLARRTGFAAAGPGVLVVAVLFFALLMLFMGGRLIAPAVAGQFYRQGDNLAARVQPRIEAALIVTMAVAIAATALGLGRAVSTLAGAAIATAGLLAAVRMVRWRLWALRARPDLLCLAAGYGWLAAGLILLGAAILAGRNVTTALHVITVGSLGTLTLNVMATTWALKARANPAHDARLRIGSTVLIGIATLARALAGLAAFDPQVLLGIAATAWSAAFALLLVFFARLRTAPAALERHQGD